MSTWQWHGIQSQCCMMEGSDTHLYPGGVKSCAFCAIVSHHILPVSHQVLTLYFIELSFLNIILSLPHHCNALCYIFTTSMVLCSVLHPVSPMQAGHHGRHPTQPGWYPAAISTDSQALLALNRPGFGPIGFHGFSLWRHYGLY